MHLIVLAGNAFLAGNCVFVVLLGKCVFAILAENVFLQFWQKMYFVVFVGKCVLRFGGGEWRESLCFTLLEKNLFLGKYVFFGKKIHFCSFVGKYVLWFWWKNTFYGVVIFHD